MFSVWAGIFAADQSCALVTWKHVCALLVPALPPPTPKTKEVFVPHSAVLCCNLKCLLLHVRKRNSLPDPENEQASYSSHDLLSAPHSYS